MDKSPDAFRTISEVADWLGVQAHVLRFWESKFPQIKPMKRGGGRRYYRPQDVALLAGVRNLLYKDGLTIKGVQKVFREQGIRWVAERGVTETAAPPPAGGAEVTELIQGYVVGRQLETTEEDLMHTVFPHPTLSEMMHESVLDAYGRAIHF